MHRLVAFLASLLAGAGFGPAPVLGQAPLGEFDLAAALDAPEVLVASQANSLTATVHNLGRAPVQAAGTATISNGTQSTVRFELTFGLVAGGQQSSRNVTWNGKLPAEPGPAGQGPREVTIQLSVRAQFQAPVDPNPGNNVATERATLRVFRLHLHVDPPDLDEFAPRNDPWTTTAVVTNRGDGRDAVRLGFFGATEGWSFGTLEGAKEIELRGPGAEARVVVWARPPPDAVGGTLGAATLTVSSKFAPGASASVRLATPPLEGTTPIQVTLTGSGQRVAPNETASFVLRLSNLRNASDTATVSLTQVAGPTGLKATLSPAGPVALPARTSANVSVNVSVPESARAGTALWTVEVFSKGTKSVARPDEQMALTVSATYAAPVIRLPSNNTTTEPGRSMPIEVWLENAGNTVDTFHATAEGLPSGWLSEPAWVPLPPGSVEPANATLSVPSWAAPGNYTVLVAANSTGDPTRRQEVPIRVEVLERAVPWFHPLPTDHSIGPNETVAFRPRVANVGNGPAAFRVLVVADRDRSRPPPEAWNVTPPQQNLTLGPGEGADLPVVVTAPASLDASDAGLFFRLAIEAIEEGDAEAGSAALEFRAGPDRPELTVELEAPADTLFLGESAAVQMTVTNRGRAPSPAGLFVQVRTSERGGATLHDRNYALVGLAGGESTALRLTIPGHLGDFVFEATVDAAEAVDESDETNNRATIAVRVAEFQVQTVAPDFLELRPGRAHSIHADDGFAASNLGSEEVALRLTVAAPGLVEAELVYPRLKPGRTGYVPVEILPPTEPSSELVQVRFKACLAREPSVCAARDARVRVPDEVPPRILEFRADGHEVAVGQSLGVRAAVVDALGVAEAVLSVTAPDGSVAETPMSPFGDGEFRAEVRFPHPGIYRLGLSAADASAARNRNASAAPLEVMVVLPVNPSLVLLSPDPGESIRPGTPILLGPGSDVPIVGLHVNKDGERVAARAHPQGFQVDTSGWPDGTANLSVRAVGPRGASGHATYAFRIDGTPPTLAGFALDPTDPRAGQQVRLTARFEDASGVRETWFCLDEAGTCLELRRDGAVGEHGATFSWPPGPVRLQFFAHDAAGNQLVFHGRASGPGRASAAEANGPAPDQRAGAVGGTGAAVVVLVGLWVLARRGPNRVPEGPPLPRESPTPWTIRRGPNRRDASKTKEHA